MSILNFQQRGSGPNIILIHGLFGSLDNLASNAKSLQEHYTVTNVDVRNHGQSFHKSDMSYPELAKDVIAVMDELNISKAHVLGHSMGGKVAMQLALDFPGRVNKLIVADIAPVKYPVRHQQIIDGLKAIDLQSISSRQQADEQLSEYVETKSIRQFLLRNITKTETGFEFKCSLDFIAQCYNQIIDGVYAKQAFEGKTLFVKGGRSDYIDIKYQATTQQLFPTAKAKVIHDAGHWLHAEKPVAFNKIIKDFLND